MDDDLHPFSAEETLHLENGVRNPVVGAATFATVENIDRARRTLRETGMMLMPGVVDGDLCRVVIETMDRHAADDRTEINYSGTELRIWDAQERHSLLREFWEESNRLVSGIERAKMQAYTLLAIRNRPVAPDDQVVTRGRWHIDSFSRQIKVFLFLTDTTDESGPFEYIPDTHRTLFKIRMLLRGAYLAPADFLTGRRAYSKLPDRLIQGFLERGAAPTPVLSKAGSVMVIDTSAIHRARPCIKGARYALTAYYR